MGAVSCPQGAEVCGAVKVLQRTAAGLSDIFTTVHFPRRWSSPASCLDGIFSYQQLEVAVHEIMHCLGASRSLPALSGGRA